MAFGGLVGGIIALGIGIYVIVTIFNSVSLNTGLYATVLNTLLPLALLAIVAAFIIGVFSGRGE